MSHIEILIVSGAFLLIASIALLGSWAKKNLDEANGFPHPADAQADEEDES
jgi:hypothetical protein